MLSEASDRVYDNHVYELLPSGYDDLDVQTVKKIIDQDNNSQTINTSRLIVQNQNLEFKVKRLYFVSNDLFCIMNWKLRKLYLSKQYETYLELRSESEEEEDNISLPSIY